MNNPHRSKEDIADAIYNKFGGELKHEIIEDAITAICSFIEERIIANMDISIHNFGTISTYLFHGHPAPNFATGEMGKIEPFRLVRLRASIALRKILKERQDHLRSSKSQKNS